MPTTIVSDDILKSVIDQYVGELTLGILLHYNRARVLGYFDELEDTPDGGEHAIIDMEGCDIFGQPKEVKVEDIQCPECLRCVAATRFAPHLEKCMGMGRNSSRVARRRIANTNNPADEDTLDEEDADLWASKPKRPKVKRNGSPKLVKKKALKLKSDLSSSPPVMITDTEGSDRETFEALSPESKEKFLRTMCGVVSEYTKKLCTRSLRCPQHSDEQRATARSLLLPSMSSLISEETGSEHNSDSSLTTDVTWAPGAKKKRGKSKAKKGLILLP
ncbi:ataxin-7-like protein 3 [Bolinopsis microptera]|uniref:ataxin-7-like protein 3 n=1 Tax=Bolinopsis microptera TaxID=2820187 RepID=UPI003079EE68